MNHFDENKNLKKTAVIIGAGPAGLTAAYELLKRTDIRPVVLEMTSDIGGISKTVNCDGYRIDIGGHRFFSKSNRVMEWWLSIFPLQGALSVDDIELGRRPVLSEKEGAPDPEKEDNVMLVRQRVSHILFSNRFFEYPLSINFQTLKNLGFVRMFKIIRSYLLYRIFPRKPEVNLEDFFINRFGKELYRTFFKDYTEKLWGVSCTEISADWGAQRIKSLSIIKALKHAIKAIFIKNKDINQRETETSLIERFIYPKYGPGQMWEEVARQIKIMGGTIIMKKEVINLRIENSRINSIDYKDCETGKTETITANHVISTMPIRNLISAFVRSRPEAVPQKVIDVSENLKYRDFITVGLLVDGLSSDIAKLSKKRGMLIEDTWLYVQEPEVRMCRVQIFNNWSPYLLKDRKKIWLGLEYILSKYDDLWKFADEEIIKYGIKEAEKIKFIDEGVVRYACVVRMEKAYPAYIGSYSQFNAIRKFTDQIENLFLIGRNGMHRYNNQDHSMLTAMAAVDNIVSDSRDKENIWSVNAEAEYHEKR